MSAPLTGPQKAALVMLSLDEAVATELMKHLEPSVLRALVGEADRIDAISARRYPEALEELAAAMVQPIVAHDAGKYVRRLAERGLGADKARAVLTPGPPVAQQPLDQLRGARPPLLAELLSEEHPQLAAVIVAQLPRAQAAKVLAAMPADKQSEVLLRVAKLEAIPAESALLASQAIAEALNSTGGGASNEERAFDGVAFAASLLNEMAPDDGKRVLDEVATAEASLAPKLREAMFTFDDLRRVDPRGLQLLMREVPSDRLLPALKTASDELKSMLLAAVSQRAAATLREDLATLPPMKLADVELAQREVVEIAMRLAADGRLVLPTGGAGELV